MRITDKAQVAALRFTREEMELYGLGALDDPAKALAYLPKRTFDRTVRPAFNDDSQKRFLEDKLVSQRFFEGFSLRFPRFHGLFHERHGVDANLEPMTTAAQVCAVLAREKPKQVVLKPRGGRRGNDVLVLDLAWDERDNGVSTRVGGRSVALHDYLDSIKDARHEHYKGRYHGWIIQEKINQHRELERVNPFSVSTVRIVTAIRRDGSCVVEAAAIRIGRQGNALDMWGHGGLSVGVDAESGIMARGVVKPAHGGGWHAVHPDTAEPMEGTRIPYWGEALALCRNAATLIPSVRWVGWDVLIADDGPVLLEGNADWDLPIVQVHTSGYLTEARLEEIEAAGVELPRRLPSAARGVLYLAKERWRQSRGPILLKALSRPAR